MRNILLLFLLCGVLRMVAAEKPLLSINTGDTLRDSIESRSTPHDDTARKNFRKEKLIASILAFPVPFGFCGLHRIYLGSEPWVPVAYLVTGGGGFGLLPLIDFVFIVTADEERFKSYENNPQFFMWIDN